jgi:hypothetical protein
MVLISGVKMRAEQYIWRGAFSVTDRLYKVNLFASWMNPQSSLTIMVDSKEGIARTSSEVPVSGQGPQASEVNALARTDGL